MFFIWIETLLLTWKIYVIMIVLEKINSVYLFNTPGRKISWFRHCPVFFFLGYIEIV
jgi:hypothetical protein